ncbi:glycoside hydrolase family 95 protein [Clostridium hydrogenum]|uniref:glycoside hydrolase family 95 protein n=1 Tax=Clostridium hydrogenum TaxID=2855764 RepID=UPI001F3FB5DF|nr:glycoside hydrolase family 95 protein [Clostridium hydrogenum]
MRLFYTKPAEKWEETLPIGNGSLGAMIWGGSERERLGLNEESIWSGYYHDKNNHDAIKYLDKARQMIIKEEYEEAEKLIQDNMLGEYNESYLPLGDLLLDFHHSKEVLNYKRILEIDNSIATITYETDGKSYRREYFASYPAKAIFMKVSSDKSAINLSVSYESQIQYCAEYSERGIKIKGKCPEHVDPSYINEAANPIIQGHRGMEYEAELRVFYSDGEIIKEKDKLNIINASTVIFAFSAVKPGKYEAGSIMNYEAIKAAHIKDYRSIYDKVELYLGEQSKLPTNERLENLRKGNKDNGLYALYFQYGRYLLISSSREGSLPANLQGIWNWELRAPWSSNWTTNINAEMNYWPAQSCNLQECLEPYFEFVKKICEEGKKTAKIHYNCRGFVHHHNADYWCSTNPAGIAHGENRGSSNSVTWSMWPMGGAWLTSELFKHYEYNPDKNFLKDTVYPILREASLFFIDWIFEYDGKYVTCPSTSPENRFKTENGGTSCVAMSSAMDLELIREVFGNFQKTCKILNIDDDILDDIYEILKKLTPFKIGSKGQLLEWHKEFEENEPGHRHISHLYGLFPSEIFADDDKLVEACRKSLMLRLENGGGYTGWSCAWIVNMFAMLEDGENLYKYLKTLLTRSTYDNLWDAHPPFQIDGNFGGTAGIANMLVQDRNGKIKILPALPKQFDEGYVKGLRIKNGKSIDIKWRNGKLEDYILIGGNEHE